MKYLIYINFSIHRIIDINIINKQKKIVSKYYIIKDLVYVTKESG